MKKFLTFAIILCCIITCTAFTACGKSVHIDEINIVEPASTEIRAGEKFTLDFVTLPEEAAESVKVKWDISDSRRLSYKNGEFTALTCGTVKVTVSAKGNTATDEIELRVIAPAGFEEYSNTGYSLVYPSSWKSSTVGAVRQWTASNGTTNMNITTESLNPTYMKASASAFQTAFETNFALMGYTVNFTQPVKVEKGKYLGVTRVQVTSIYTLTVGSRTSSIHQTQMIFNNESAGLSCVLTVTFHEENFDDLAVQMQNTIFSQFMPA